MPIDKNKIVFWKSLKTYMYTDPVTESTICGDSFEELERKIHESRNVFLELDK
jgi:hypothetical protein